MRDRLGIVLAAGQGTRMNTDLPKVLVEVCGRAMIHYVLDALRAGGVEKIVLVVGHRGDLVRERLAGDPALSFVDQVPQRGTGHAVMMCRPVLAGHDGATVVLAGDSPLTQGSSIRTLLEQFDRQRPACILGTTRAADPAGLGRIVRDAAGQFARIVEEKDATAEEVKITEVNLSTYVFATQPLLRALDQLTTDNAQAEYYITDCPGILMQQGGVVQALDVLDPCEALSINTLAQRDVVEAKMRKQSGPQHWPR